MRRALGRGAMMLQPDGRELGEYIVSLNLDDHPDLLRNFPGGDAGDQF